MNIGFHTSTAGGFRNVIPRAVERNSTTIQIFSRNPRQWVHKHLDPEDIAVFKSMREAENIDPVFVHMPYIVNLGSADRDLFARSIDSLTTELKRSERLGADYVIVHAGSSEDMKAGIRRMAHGIERALNTVRNTIAVLIENTPGSGREFGHTFAHLGMILRDLPRRRAGIVLDTAHAYAAGYPIDTRHGVDAMLKEVERLFGVRRVHLVHFNDSKTSCGARFDRHEHVGKGRIGKGMRYIINHPLLREKPFIMETPRMDVKDDRRNLATVRRYLGRGKA